jgi:hypothetical protein
LLADHRPWLKLWKTAYSDPGLERLSLEDQARWMRLLLFVGINGERGSITLSKGTEQLFSCFRKRSASAVRTILDAMPGVTVSDDEPPSPSITVTFTKWPKYQVDSSAERTRDWRQRTQNGDGNPASHVTATPRHSTALGDGARVDKTRKEVDSPPLPLHTSEDRFRDWKAKRRQRDQPMAVPTSADEEFTGHLERLRAKFGDPEPDEEAPF